MNVTLSFVPNNNHGCSGEDLVISPITDRTGIVVEANSCTSCWQVGHDRKSQESFRRKYLDHVVHIPEGMTMTWSVAEQNATEERMRHRDVSLPYASRVTPDELTVGIKLDRR